MQRRHVSGSLTLPVRHTAKQRRFPAYQRTEHGPPLVRQHVPVSSKARKTPFRVLLRTRGMARICHKADKFLTRQQKKFFIYTQNEKDVNLFIFYNNINILHQISTSACFRRPAMSIPFLQYRAEALRESLLLSRKKQRLPFSGDPTADVHFIQKKKDDTLTQLPFPPSSVLNDKKKKHKKIS